MRILTIFMIFVNTFFAQTFNPAKTVTIWKLDGKNSLRSYEISLLSSVLIKNDIKFEYRSVKNVAELYKAIEQANKNNDPYHIAISNINITDEKKKQYSFSIPYFSSSYALMGNFRSDATTLKIGYVKNQGLEPKLKQFLADQNIAYEAVEFKNIKDGIMQLKQDKFDNAKPIHYMFSDYEDAFVNKNLITVETFLEKDQFIGMMFPKNSNLKSIIDPLLSEYLNSDMDKKYISRYLGSHAVQFVTSTRK